MMKKHFVVILLVAITLEISAQETSLNDYSGDWSNNSSWVGGWTDGSPAFTGLPETNANITIQGKIDVGTPAAEQNLTFSANKDSYDFIVNDTLIVYGDVDFANKAMNLVLGDDAVLIILGDLDMNNRIDISSGGTLVIQGTFSKSGSQGSFTGDGNVYAGAYSGDAVSTVDSDGDSSFTLDQLSDDGFTEIEEFVDEDGAETPLPVELIYFHAEGTALPNLKWATSVEINNDYFSIERSEDGEFFYEIGKVKGNGNTNDVISYSFEDQFTISSIEYYRLKQVDYNGDYEHFSAIRVETPISVESTQFNIYPTLITNGNFRISANKPFEIKEFSIFNISGQSVYDIKNTTIKENMLTFLSDISFLGKGIYLLNFTSTAGDQKSKRIVIK